MIKLIKESMDGKDVISKIEYIRDALDELENYVNQIGSIPDDLATSLNNIYQSADMIYQNTQWIKEATSNIGGAYKTHSVDMIPVNMKKVKEKLESKDTDKYLKDINKETTKTGLVNILHDIRSDKELSQSDKKQLEMTIKKSIKSIR